MTTIVTRAGKGSALTHTELDNNFTNLNTDKVEASGDSMTGNLSFGDNNKAVFGAGSDLQIYHDGSNSYIQDSGTGDLELRGTNFKIGSATGSVQFIETSSFGLWTRLKYNSDVKLSTTSTGIDVTGTVTADGLTVDGDVLVRNPGSGLNTVGATLVLGAGPNGPKIESYQQSADSDVEGLRFYTKNSGAFSSPSTLRMSVEYNGDISFYEDTGTTAKFFWDASAESLELGTSASMTPTASLAINEVVGGTPAIEIIPTTDATSDITASIRLWGTIYGTANRHSEICNITDGSTASNELAFKTNGTEAMRIDSSGNVGIGSTNTGGFKLDVVGTARANNLVFRADTSTPSGDAGIFRPSSGTLALSTNSTERMRIDASGNVGIGTTSPSYKLDVAGTVRIGSGGSIQPILYRDGTTGCLVADTTGAAGASLIVKNNGSESARIDGSGNLLVGQTSQSPNTVGASLNNNGNISAKRNGGIVTILNRGTSDGEILSIRKDDVTVGSIGAQTGYLTIGQAGATDAFLSFTGVSQPAIRPASSTSVNSDNTTDLGSSSARFKNLYLSGGVYLGGTGAANLLDDYEEGTFSATLTPATSGTLTLNAYADVLSYVKIGNLVHVQGNLRIDSISSPVGATVSLNLPFANPTAGDYLERTFSSVLFYDASTATTSIIFFTTVDGTSSSVDIAIDASTLDAGDQFRFNFSYRTSF